MTTPAQPVTSRPRCGASLRDHVRAYLLGIREARTAWTTHYDLPLLETYDRGREHFHRLTRRRFEP